MTFVYRVSSLGSDGDPDTRLAMLLDGETSKAGEFFLPATPGGSFSVTGVGFQPDMVFVISALTRGYATGITGRLQFGCATAPDEQWSWANSCGNIVPRWRHGVLTPDWLIASPYNALTYRVRAALASFDADGFTLDIEEQDMTGISNSGAGAMLVIYIAVKGGPFKAGIATAPTAVGVQDVQGLGFAPKGIFLASAARVNHDINTGWNYSAGYCDAELNQSALWGGARPLSENGWFPRSTNRWQNDAALTIERAANGPSFAGTTTLARAACTAMLADGFRLNWTTVDAANAYKFAYLATGDDAEFQEIVVPGGDPGEVTQPSRFCPLAIIGSGMLYTTARNPNVYNFGSLAPISAGAGDPWTSTFAEEGGASMKEINVTTVGYIQESGGAIETNHILGMGLGSFPTHKMNVLRCKPPLVGMNWREADRRGFNLRGLQNPSDQV